MEVVQRINEAVNFAKNGDVHAAEEIYLQLMSQYPTDKRVYPFLGWLYLNTKRYQDAIEVFYRAEDRTSLNVVTGLGISYYSLGLYTKAYPYLKISAEQTPTLQLLYYYIDSACENSKDVNSIWQMAQKMDELYPDSIKTWESFILAALCAGKFAEAEEYCNAKLLENPECPDLYLSAGLVQEVLYSNFELAKECYLKALELKPSLPVYYNLGLVSSRLKEFKDAEFYFSEALKYDSEIREVNTALYIALAAQKKFEQAYSCFKKATRPMFEEFHDSWEGADCTEEVLFVYADQGFGDIIMYSRYLTFLQGKFKKVIFSVPKQLKRLMAINFRSPFFKVVEYGEVVEYDKSTVLTMLPYLLKLDYNNIPLSDGYLSVSENLCALPNNDSCLKVGFVWEAGGTKLRGSLDRTININYFDEMMKLDGVKFYSLQLNAAMRACDKYQELEDLSYLIEDFLDTASIINSLDVVVAVDTSVAHLAAALGKKTFIMLPKSADWRWFEDKEKTPWYSSVELFVQDNYLDWSDVVKSVTQRLEELK